MSIKFHNKDVNLNRALDPGFWIQFMQTTVKELETSAGVSYRRSGNHFQPQYLQMSPRAPEMAEV